MNTINLDKTNSELIEMVNALAIDKTYNCYTRQGFELIVWNEIKNNATFVIFCDIDNMHDANEKYGYSSVDEKIKNSIVVRSEDDVIVSRYYSGDEINFIIKNGNPFEMAKRILDNFVSNGLSATFGIAKIESDNFSENVKVAADKVQLAKKENRRGTIN